MNRIDITIDPDDWQAMQDDMKNLYGEFGNNSFGGPQGNPPVPGNPPQPGNHPPPGSPPPQGAPSAQGAPPQGGPMDKGGMDANPMWVAATLEFDGDTWTNVGVRFKGNSTLRGAWSQGSWKLPLKLDFDEFEDEYPEIDDQRFYGFKQLSLSSNFNDESFLREKVAADIFREAGVPAAHTAFYRVYVDYGEGSIYFGLYTMVEVVDDTVIEEQFEDDSGNLYKPEGPGASFAYGSFSEQVFDKETNEDESDWSDILALYDALHASERSTDPAAWRNNLEAVLDVDGFLNWLAVNTVLQNWDTYGIMAHNYYLYNDPTTGLLTWIPWDNNEAISEGKMHGILSISLEEATAEWPLISFLMDDDFYKAKYVAYVEETANDVFEPSRMIARYIELHDLVAPYVSGVEGELPGYTSLRSTASFDTSLDFLANHVNSRYAEAMAYVSSQ